MPYVIGPMSNLIPADELNDRARAAGLTQSEWCGRAGIAVSTLIRWKKKRNSINIANYEKLVAVLAEAEKALGEQAA